MTTDALQTFIGEWEVSVDIPGAEDARGRAVFEWLGSILVQRAETPDPAPNSVTLMVAQPHGGYMQHYFDSRGVARLYSMTFDGNEWTLVRSAPDFSPLDFHQRYVGRFSPDGATIDGTWETSDDGATWRRDFALVYRRV